MVFKREACWVRLYASQCFWTIKWGGGQFLCCPPTLKSGGGSRPPRSTPLWVLPIYKKGEKDQASNYRPVSLTSFTCKVLEHIVDSTTMKHFEKKQVLCIIQHGFRCESQLLITVNEIANQLTAGHQIDVILLDLSKTFDRVPHGRFLHKLDYYGIRENTFHPGECHVGSAQGHRLIGPLLFLSYINDFPDVRSSCTKLFADDCHLFKWEMKHSCNIPYI